MAVSNGADGVPGAVLIVMVAELVQPAALRTVMVWFPAATAVKVPVFWKVPLSSWYSSPGTALVTVMVPDCVAQVGCMADSAGTAGVAGAAFMVMVAELVQPAALRTVIVWFPEATPVKVPVFWNVPLSSWYSRPPAALVMVMLPATVQVGCVALSAGATGVAGCAFMVTVAELVQPVALRTVTVWLPAATLLKVAVAWNAPLSNWYCNPVAVLVTVMLPVAVVQVGCVGLSAGTAGVAGCAFMVMVAELVQPAALRTVTVWLPVATLLKVAVVWNAPLSN